MNSTATTVSEYLEELPPDRRAALGELRSLIHRVAPEVVEAMKCGMPSFGKLCALSSHESYMALCVSEGHIVKAHLAQLGKVSCGKGCIRFKHIDDLNLDVVECILKEVLRLRKQGIGPIGRVCTTLMPSAWTSSDGARDRRVLLPAPQY